MLLSITLLYAGSANRIFLSYGEITEMMASLFFAKGITTEELQNRYNSDSGESKSLKKVKILVVPGHFPNKGGGEFGSVKERNMAVSLGKNLVSFLEENERFEVLLARDDTRFIKEIGEYVINNKKEIEKWISEHKNEMNSLIENGKVIDIDGPPHNTINQEDANDLYGVNKWANENDVALVINIHFNDYPRKSSTTIGKYYGFTVYVPENQYGNAESSGEVADYIANRLGLFLPTSNMPKEKGGVVEDQDLIALGRFNTSKTASILIEYGYIYEPMFRTKETREVVLREMAYQTYLSIEEFFGVIHEEVSFITNKEDMKIFSGADTPTPEALRLQLALIGNGLYPPNGKTLQDCPLTGIIGNCTKEALRDFQKIGEIPQTGKLNKETVSIFNKLKVQNEEGEQALAN